MDRARSWCVSFSTPSAERHLRHTRLDGHHSHGEGHDDDAQAFSTLTMALPSGLGAANRRLAADHLLGVQHTGGGVSAEYVVDVISGDVNYVFSGNAAAGVLHAQEDDPRPIIRFAAPDCW